MRTWKQGAVGKVLLEDDRLVFLKCLKYPLAVFYRNYSRESGLLDGKLFYAFLNLSILPYIERVDEIKMSPFDKKISACFSVDFSANTITMAADTRSGVILDIDSSKPLTMHDLEDSLDKFWG